MLNINKELAEGPNSSGRRALLYDILTNNQIRPQDKQTERIVAEALLVVAAEYSCFPMLYAIQCLQSFKTQLRRYLVPLSKGSRKCLGMKYVPRLWTESRPPFSDDKPWPLTEPLKLQSRILRALPHSRRQFRPRSIQIRAI